MKKIMTIKRALFVIGIASFLLTNKSLANTLSQGKGSSSDTIPPVLTLNGKDTVYVEILDTYIEVGAVAVDNKDGNITSAIVYNGSVNTSAMGIYILTYTVKDVSGNQSSKIRVVIVADTQKPVISNSDANDSNEVKVLAGSIFINRTKVKDNYDTPALIETLGSMGNVNTSVLGIYPITYNATDQSGNKAETKIYKFIVGDFLGPTINLNTSDTVLWPVNTMYKPVDPTLKDNYYPNSQLSLTRTNNINVFKLGVYYEEYTATDGSGNITKRLRWVRIMDDEAPVISGLSLHVAKFSNPDFREGLTITDNYDAPAALLPRLTEIFNNVNTSVDGLYAITFQVTDLSGNISLPFQRIILVGSASNALGLDENNKVTMYPNPSTGIIHVINHCDSPSDMEIEIYNETGQLIAQFDGSLGKNGLQTLDLSEESKGLYTVKVKTNRSTFIQKVSIIK